MFTESVFVRVRRGAVRLAGLSTLCFALFLLALCALTRSSVATAGDPAPNAATMPAFQGRLATLERPYQPTQQTDLGFGARSHWLQPWRAYQETTPASKLLDALGININGVPTQNVPAVAQLLHAAGFHRARYEIGWCNISYDNPNAFTNPQPILATLRAFKAADLRPLILLNANEGCPGPLRHFQLRLTAPAQKGARTLQLDPASAGQVVPGYTGLDSTTRYEAAAYIVTSVSGTTATLSRPLAVGLKAGAYWASTLRYEPFRRQGDPGYARTLAGWLSYVGTVGRTVKSVLGDENLDVEVWNELTFGSDFLDINNYYSPAVAKGGQDYRALLEATVNYIRSPSSGIDRIGIGNGFCNQWPWCSGAISVPGLTAMDHHPYAGRKVFPRDAVINGNMPFNALGQPDGWRDKQHNAHDNWIPSYTAFFPEYYLTAIQTETLIRDLSPIATPIYGAMHGRFTHPAGSPPVQNWITEVSLDPSGIPASVLPRFKAKEALRYITSYVNKGANALYLYSAGDGASAFVDPTAPGGGTALTALHRLTATLKQGATPITKPQSVSLEAVTGSTDDVQFAGDGTAVHPPLYDADVVGYFPYQTSNTRVAIALYVMTRDLMHVYQPSLGAGDPARYDMPPERFRLTLDGVETLGRSISLFDPLDGTSDPVQVVSRSGDELVVDVPLTDSPRLLEIG